MTLFKPLPRQWVLTKKDGLLIKSGKAVNAPVIGAYLLGEYGEYRIPDKITIQTENEQFDYVRVDAQVENK